MHNKAVRKQEQDGSVFNKQTISIQHLPIPDSEDLERLEKYNQASLSNLWIWQNLSKRIGTIKI